MLSTRWRKTLRDLWLNKTRTFLVVLAIAVGILGVGSILTAYSILTREMDRNYMDTNPASAILYLEGVDADLVQAVEARPEIAQAEARRTVNARYQLDENQWLTIRLFVVADFDDLRVNTYTSERGGWTPAADEILLERADLSLIEDDLGDTAIIKTPGNAPQEMQINGIVHDPGQAPAWMEGFVYGYISPAGLARLGEVPIFTELRVIFAENNLDQGSNLTAAKSLRATLESEGYSVNRIQVPVPGEHPHNDQLVTLLFILQSFGVLALLLSGMLVTTMISALIEQQIRQIGVMKTLGAGRTQIAGVYLGTVSVLGLLALVVGAPLGNMLGRAYSDFAAGQLNFTIASYSVDGWVYLVEFAAALLIPIIGAGFPVWRGSRITVREAISASGVSENAVGVRPIDTLLGRVQGLGRTLLLSLRNIFRRQGRLLLTLLTLAVGGAVFMVALNVGSSWTNTVDGEFEARNFDSMLRLKQPYDVARLEDALSDVSDVLALEAWNEAQASLLYSNGDNGDLFRMVGLPPETPMLDMPVMEGRWLRPEDENALVVTHMLVDHEPSLTVGSEVEIELNGQITAWTVVGIIRQIGPNIAYSNQEILATLTTQRGQSNTFTVVSTDHSAEGQAASLQAIEAALADADIAVAAAGTSLDGKQVLDDHLLIIVSLLMIMAILVAVVSGLGLASTMSLNVLERQREIGVMRAVGAKSLKVLQIILVEGVFIGLLSWLLAMLLSLPLTSVIGNAAGKLFIEAPLNIVYSWSGFGIWLGVVLILTAIASALPAVNATEMPVHEVLAYE